MAICSKCKNKIKYNKYKMYRGKILCKICYSKRNKKITQEASTADIIVEPTEESFNPFEEAKEE